MEAEGPVLIQLTIVHAAAKPGAAGGNLVELGLCIRYRNTAMLQLFFAARFFVCALSRLGHKSPSNTAKRCRDDNAQENKGEMNDDSVEPVPGSVIFREREVGPIGFILLGWE